MIRRPVARSRLASLKLKFFARGGSTGSSVAAPAGLGLDSQAVRSRMVQKLAAQGLADARVLAAMGAVERHRFVDSALVNQAYEDTSLPIGLGQTISQPYIVALMTDLLQVGPDDAVLEMGHAVGLAAPGLFQLDSLRELVEQPTAPAEQGKGGRQPGQAGDQAPALRVDGREDQRRAQDSLFDDHRRRIRHRRRPARAPVP